MERDARTRNRIDTIKADTHDALDEAKQRVEAGGERVKRAVEGDRMPLGERVVSHVKEAGHNVAGDFDRSKREVRNDDLRDDEGI